MKFDRWAHKGTDPASSRNKQSRLFCSPGSQVCTDKSRLGAGWPEADKTIPAGGRPGCVSELSAQLRGRSRICMGDGEVGGREQEEGGALQSTEMLYVSS